MIKPASSGDLRITTGFFPPFSVSLPARGRYNYWGNKSSCAAAESQPFGGWSSCATNRKKGEKNICKHVYLNVNGLPIMGVEIKSKMKDNLVKPPISTLRWASISTALTHRGIKTEALSWTYQGLTSQPWIDNTTITSTPTNPWGQLAIHDWDIMVLFSDRVQCSLTNWSLATGCQSIHQT